MDMPEQPNSKINFSQLGIIIPAYQPGEALLQLVGELLQKDYSQIVVVNDGSDPSKQNIFSEVAKLSRVTVLTHPKNLGKGEALKTGAKWFLQNADANFVGVITVDADGQHLETDVDKIATALLQQPQDLILGYRLFNQQVPWRSRFGNSLTSTLFRWQYRLKIYDTQTGLRGIPKTLLKEFLQIPVGRYEYEMACLIYAVRNKYPIEQIPVETVYIDSNASSHFNPVVDSMRIYYVFLRFAVTSFLSYLIDLGLFILFHALTHGIFVSLLVARLISSSFNFYQNKFAVYRSHNLKTIHYEIAGYVLLSIVVFFVSYFCIVALVKAGFGVIFAKIIVDLFLFTINFLIQQFVIFKNRR